MNTTQGRSRQGLIVVLMIAMPLIVLVFLGSQMALQQVVSKSATYQDMPEITEVASLRHLPPNTRVMLRGQLVSGAGSADHDLLVYQERPADGREVRFREVFEPHFPVMNIALSDGLVRIVPRPESTYVIRRPHHVATVGDRQRIGFRRGDVVTVQGKWQPDQAGLPTLTDATGIMGMDKASLFSDWQRAICNVTWVSRLAGLLSVLGMADAHLAYTATASACSH
ncbi:hypothetical protein C2W62_15880 [Candidatus Entotheonella serta]|nr:hypothetical protein C2W62_15880 [Candidatus Entotheonella serta]